MKRVGASVVVGLGLFGRAPAADAPTWRPVPSNPATPTLVVPSAKPAAMPVIPVSFAPTAAVPQTTSNEPAAKLVWVPARVPSAPVPSSVPAFLPAPVVEATSEPPQFRPAAMLQAGGEPEKLPLPRVADPSSKELGGELPPPRSVPTQIPPQPALGEIVPDPRCQSVWGAKPYCPPGEVVQAGAVAPMDHGKFGSAEVQLSKDHSFGDLFDRPPRYREDRDGLLAGARGDAAAGLDRYYVRGEYLLWWMNRGNIPVLASTSNNGGFGFLGDPGTIPLLGPGPFGPTGPYSGMRVRGGWLNEALNCGVDGSFFFLGSQTESFASNLPTLTRPFFAPNIPGEFGELVSFPGLATGNLLVQTSSSLYGFDANFRIPDCRTCDRRREWFVGYRHLGLDENLTMTESITAGPNATQPEGTRILVQDKFETQNRFNGAQVGYAFERRRGNWDIDGRLSAAVGATTQTVTISGYQLVTPPGGATASFTGGLLAAGPNLGKFTKTRFSFVPEATLNVGYWFTPSFRGYVGYNLLYWTNVIRPGDQIDRVVDLSFVPNSPTTVTSAFRPQPTFTASDLLVQGVQFGVEFRW